MIIGVPKEIKNNENRVALTPAGAQELTKRGHTVYVQKTAGEGSGFSDEEYQGAGAQMIQDAAEVYQLAEMIIKVKEPIEPEYKLIKEGQLVFTYFHFASYEPLTKAMIQSKAVCLAYETVESADRSLPLLVPMSEVAGRNGDPGRCKIFREAFKGTRYFIRRCTGCKACKSFDFRRWSCWNQRGKNRCGYGGGCYYHRCEP
jgi:alanine dehydrogenase